MNQPDRKSNRARFAIVQAITLVRIPLAVGFAAVLLPRRDLLVASGHASFQEFLQSGRVGSIMAALALCAAILLVIELTDLFDGLAARRLEVVSEWGAMLDPYSDSIARIVVYWALACGGLALVYVPLAMAVRDITVAYCRVVLARRGKSVSARLSGKIKAIVQGIGALLLLSGPLYWPLVGLWPRVVFSWLIVGITLASAVEYFRSALRAAAGGQSGECGHEAGGPDDQAGRGQGTATY